MNSQKGAAHIVLVLRLLAGLGVGVFLVQKQTNISPKAYSPKNPVSAPITPRPTKSPNPSGKNGGAVVEICHKTDSDKNPYVLISINGNALGEHKAHGDIYPVPEEGCPTSSPVPVPSATCYPRPACLDSTPRCLLPEPTEGWCPTSL